VNAETVRPEWSGDAPVLIISGRGALDDSASRILAQILFKHGIGSRIVGTDAISTSNLLRLDPSGVAMVCFSYLDPSSLIPARTAVKRIRRRIPKAQTLLGLWRSPDHDVHTDPPLEVLADHYASTFQDALRLCIASATSTSGDREPVMQRAPDKEPQQKFADAAADKRSVPTDGALRPPMAGGRVT